MRCGPEDYAVWCQHCKDLVPVLEEIATQQKGNFFVGKVNCEHGDNGALCRALRVPSYPGVAVWKDGRFKDWFTGLRTVETILKWVTAFEEEELPADQRDIHDVVTLTANDFRRTIARGNWIVDFYAPWCVACEEMMSVWDELAIEENPKGRVMVAKVDCTRHAKLCDKFEVTEFPSIQFFSNGEKKAKFKGHRDASGFDDFIVQHSGVIA